MGIKIAFCRVNIRVQRKLESMGIVGEGMQNEELEVLEKMMRDMTRESFFEAN